MNKSLMAGLATAIGMFVFMLTLFHSPATAFGSAVFSFDTYRYHEGVAGEDHGIYNAADKVSGGNYPNVYGGSIGITDGYGFASGYANATSLKTGISTTAGSYTAGWGGSSYATASIANSFTVRSNVLAPNSLVSMVLPLRLDGRLNVSSSADAHGGAELGIYDLTKRKTFEGGEYYQPELAYFSAKWDVGYAGYGNMLEAGWQAGHDLGFTQGGHDSFDYYGACTPGDPSCSYYSDRDFEGRYIFDTGSLALNFKAEVGHTYVLYENIFNLSEADGLTGSDQPTQSVADFSRTFAGDAVSSNPDVVLEWGIARSTETTPVPEPATMLFFGIGLAALAVCGRNKRS